MRSEFPLVKLDAEIMTYYDGTWPQQPKRKQCPDPRPLWLLVGTPLIIGSELASKRAKYSLL